MELSQFMAFFKANLRLITILTVSGLILATVYVVVAPKIYKATGLIKVAQFNAADIENVETLKTRMAMPGQYSNDIRLSCGDDIKSNEVDSFVKKVTFSVIKKSPSEVELSVLAISPELAAQCANMLFLMISKQQMQLIEEKMLGSAEIKQLAESLIAIDEKKVAAISVSMTSNLGFLARLERINALKSKLDALYEQQLVAYLHPTKLSTPIYVSSNWVSPKPLLLMLIVGGGLGLMFGVLLSLLRNKLSKAK